MPTGVGSLGTGIIEGKGSYDSDGGRDSPGAQISFGISDSVTYSSIIKSPDGFLKNSPMLEDPKNIGSGTTPKKRSRRQLRVPERCLQKPPSLQEDPLTQLAEGSGLCLDPNRRFSISLWRGLDKLVDHFGLEPIGCLHVPVSPLGVERFSKNLRGRRHGSDMQPLSLTDKSPTSCKDQKTRIKSA